MVNQQRDLSPAKRDTVSVCVSSSGPSLNGGGTIEQADAAGLVWGSALHQYQEWKSER